MTALAFSVPGNPIPKARARVVAGHAHTPEATRRYERGVRLHAMAALGRAKRAGIRWPLDARYEVQLVIHRSDARRVDADNICKAATDACNGLLWGDDAQIDHLVVSRGDLDREAPRLLVLVRAMTPAESEATALAVEHCMRDLHAPYSAPAVPAQSGPQGPKSAARASRVRREGRHT